MQTKAQATLTDVQESTRKYSHARDEISDRVRAMNDAIEALTREHMVAIKGWVRSCAERKAALHALIESSPALFESPRTHVFFGTKVGLKKGAGAITFEDEDQVIARAEKKLPRDTVDMLVKVEKSLSKTALKALDVRELEMIGCEVEGSSDRVVIASVDKDVEKVVKALLKDAVDQAQQEAA